MFRSNFGRKCHVSDTPSNAVYVTLIIANVLPNFMARISLLSRYDFRYGIACINRTTYNNDNVLGNEKVLCTEECSVYFYSLCFCHNYELQCCSNQTEIAIIENALERYLGYSLMRDLFSKISKNR